LQTVSETRTDVFITQSSAAPELIIANSTAQGIAAILVGLQWRNSVHGGCHRHLVYGNCLVAVYNGNLANTTMPARRHVWN